MKTPIKASCTWGDGPDVLLTIGDDPCLWHDLTASEAEALGHQLISAAKQAQDLEELCEFADNPDHDHPAYWRNYCCGE